MNILELILSRRTVHTYTEEAVPQKIVEEAILAAIHAPNHKMTWPWHFLIAGPKSRKQLGELLIQIKQQSGEVTDAAKIGFLKKYQDEGSLIVPVINKAADTTLYKEDYAAMSCALQNMALYLWGQGYGSKWSTGAIIQHPEAYRILDVDAETKEICGFFWMGRSRGATKSVSRPNQQQFTKYLP